VTGGRHDRNERNTIEFEMAGVTPAILFLLSGSVAAECAAFDPAPPLRLVGREEFFTCAGCASDMFLFSCSHVRTANRCPLRLDMLVLSRGRISAGAFRSPLRCALP
jgi:hypothetical protein